MSLLGWGWRTAAIAVQWLLRRINFGLRPRFALLVLLAALPALILLIQHSREERAGLVVGAEQRALRLTRTWAANHDAVVSEAMLVLRLIARDASVRGAAAPGSAATPECETALAKIARETGWRSVIAIVDRDGRPPCLSDRESLPMVEAMSAAFMEDVFDSPQVQVSEFKLDNRGRAVAFVGLRLQDAPGEEPHRMAVAGIELSAIKSRTDPAAEGAPYTLTLVDRSGHVLVRDPRPVGANAFSAGLPYLGDDHPLVRQLSIRAEGSGSGRDEDRIDRLFAFTQLPQTGAKVIIGLAREDILSAQEREADRLLLLLGVTAGLAVIAAWILAEFSVFLEARRLTRAAEALGKGDLAHRIESTSSTAIEFRTVGRAFNRMAARLQTRLREIEQARRTLEARSEALAVSEARFRDVASSASDWIWERAADLHLTYVSGRFVDAIEGDPAAAEACPADLIELSGVTPAGHRALLAPFATGMAFRDVVCEVETTRRGRRFWRISGNPILDATGAIIGWRGTGSDVTDRRAAETALLAAKEEAETASRMKSEFLANMSHELRTPLNAVLGFSEIIRDARFGPVAARYQAYAGNIHSSGSHLLAIINDLLDISRIEAGRLELYDEPVRVADIVDYCTALLAGRAEGASVTIETAGVDGALTVRADTVRLRQILLNLMSNGVKFTPPGGSVLVTAGVDPADGALVLGVTDTGIGMSPEQLGVALEPFGRIDSTYSRRQEGTGLGLPIAQRLVRLHGGTLSIDSALGTGTTVRVRLPADRLLAPFTTPATAAG